MTDPDQLESWLRENGISSVRLEATNHDGMLLGKHLAPAKFLSVATKGAQMADTTFGLDFSGDVSFGWDWGDWRGNVADVTVIPDLNTLHADRCNPGVQVRRTVATHGVGRLLFIEAFGSLRIVGTIGRSAVHPSDLVIPRACCEV